MLYGAFSEKRPTVGDWIVSFPEDDWQSFKIALHLIHGDAYEVPKAPDEHTLYKLLVFIDKWDLFRMFEPFRDTWSRRVGFRIYTPSIQFEYALTAGCIIGDDWVLRRFLWKLARYSYIDEEGYFNLCYAAGAVVNVDEHYADADILVGKLSICHLLGRTNPNFRCCGQF